MKHTNAVMPALLCASAFFSSTAQANSVSLEIRNLTSTNIELVSGSPTGLPTIIAPNDAQIVSLSFAGNRSDIEATYRNVTNGTTCRFTASHIVQTSGPYFNKTATPIGTPQASCLAFQSPTWSAPYNYSATFSFYF